VDLLNVLLLVLLLLLLLPSLPAPTDCTVLRDCECVDDGTVGKQAKSERAAAIEAAKQHCMRNTR